MASNVYETNKEGIIGAMNEVINKLDSDGDNSFKKDKKELLTRIKNLYTAERTKKNFDLFVKTANIHENVNFGQTNSFKIFQAMLNQYNVTSIEITNERFKDLSEAKQVIERQTQPVQAVVLQPDPAQALSEHQAAHRELLESEKSRFSNLLSENTPQKEEMIRQFQEFLNGKYPEPTNVGTPITLDSNLTEQFFTEKFNTVLKFPTLHSFLKSDTNTKSTFANNLHNSINKNSFSLYRLYADLQLLPSHSQPTDSAVSNNTDDNVASISSDSSSSSISENLASSSAGVVTTTQLNTTQKSAVSGLKLIFDPKYAALKPHESFKLSDEEKSLFKDAMQASIEALSSIGFNKEDKKEILTEIKELFENSTDLEKQFNLIHLFMEVAKTHRTVFKYGFFEAKETNSFLEFKNALANNLLDKLIPSQSSGPSNT